MLTSLFGRASSCQLSSACTYFPTKPLAQDCTSGGGFLFNSAHLFQKYFRGSWIACAKIESEEVRRGSRRQSNQLGSIIAIDASHSRRCAACKEGTERCFLQKRHAIWPAASLPARPMQATTSLHTEPATVRVYERLRRQLGAPVGVDGFQALASRALALAKSQSPRLSAVQVTANGGLRGLGEVESQTDADEDGEAGITLIAQLLGLFLTFLGEATTLRLIEDLRLQADVSPRVGHHHRGHISLSGRWTGNGCGFRGPSAGN